MSLPYIKQLHDLHEQWLFYKFKFDCPAPVLIVDANKTRTDIIHEYDRVIRVIQSFSPDLSDDDDDNVVINTLNSGLFTVD